MDVDEEEELEEPTEEELADFFSGDEDDEVVDNALSAGGTLNMDEMMTGVLIED